MTPDELAKIRNRAQEVTIIDWVFVTQGDATFTQIVRKDIPALLAYIAELEVAVASVDAGPGDGAEAGDGR